LALLAGIAISTLAVAQSTTPDAAFPTNPSLGPAFATRNAAYVPVLFEEIPGWEEENLAALKTAFVDNCRAMRKRSAWAPVCDKLTALPADDAALRQFLRDEFYAYQILTPTRSATGKLTGYFEPLIAGSLRREGAYRYPVYGTPADLLTVEARTVAGQLTRWLKVNDGMLVGAEPGSPGAREYRIDLAGAQPNPRDKRYRVRIDGNTIRPYYTRQQIDSNGIDAPVLAWVADPYKLYSMQIQGSGKIQLKDGGLIRLAYAEQNGQPFMPTVTRGDADAVLLAIKARGLEQPIEVEVPSATTRGMKKPVNAGVDAEVARIIAALQGSTGHSASPSPVTQARPTPTASKRPARHTPARANAMEVEAMIQLLLHAPVADPDEVASLVSSNQPHDADATPAPAPATNDAPRPQGLTTTTGKPPGPAIGKGVPVPDTGIPDPSYVFFRRIPDSPEGPIGALGIPLQAGRSIAVDPRATPLGAPVFIDGVQPGSNTPMRRLVFAQDTGGAIRGSVRGDFFWGFGDEAGKLALATNQPVRMWLLLPKAVASQAASSSIKTRGHVAMRDCAVPDDELCVEE
jgi:membrane-bound lytic murein transglycosylase A